MNSQQASEGWDFTPVINLISSLSITPDNPPGTWASWKDSSGVPLESPSQTGGLDTYSGLGNFDKIWEFLGQPLSGPSERLRKVSSAADITSMGDELDKAVATVKLVKWRDEIEGANLADTDSPESSPNRYYRAQQRAKRVSQVSPAGREIEDADLAAKNGSERAVNSASSGKSQQGRYRGKDLRQHRARKIVQAPPGGRETESEPDEGNIKPHLDRRTVIQQTLHGVRALDNQKSRKRLLSPREKSEAQSDPESRLYNWRRHSKRPQLPVSSSDRTEYATAAERKSRLVSKLRSMFMDEQQYLSNIGVPGHSTSGTETGVHVFVDASNIMIGFQDALKLSRGIKIRLRCRSLSFHNLSLILERGRPTSKRVLVGSDNFPAVQEAKVIGYEINILERVHKAKELTPRNKRYSNTSNGQSSGSETTEPILGPEKWVEQAVDEILHLKILESLIDAKTPATIVLATGDGTEAEYSQGFLKMVERALERGWKVELVSFNHNTSNSYRKKTFRAKWGPHFRIIELDEFVEELLNV